MFTEKELAIVDALLEEEILNVMTCGEGFGRDIISRYLDTLEGIHEKIESLNAGGQKAIRRDPEYLQLANA